MLEVKCQENARAIAQQMKNSGGGSGSEVKVTQVLSSGTKIATIKVDDDSTDLYCEAVPATYDAEDVDYDNTTSGLTATDVQAAIDELAQGGGAGTWTLAGSETGTTAIAMPANANEIIAIVSTTTASASIIIPVAALTSSSENFYLPGGYADAAAYYYGYVGVSTSSIAIGNVIVNGSVVTSTATIKVYYR